MTDKTLTVGRINFGPPVPCDPIQLVDPVGCTIETSRQGNHAEVIIRGPASTAEPPSRHAPTCPMSQRPLPPEDWPPIGTVPPPLDAPASALSPETIRTANLATLRELLGYLRQLGTEQEEWADAVEWGLRALQEDHP